MKNSTYTLTSTQHSFVTAIRPHLAAFGLSAKTTDNGQSVQFSPLLKAAQKAGYSAVPAWCMDKSRKCGRGMYVLPELSADDSAFIVTAVKRGRPAGASAKTVKTTVKTVDRGAAALASVVADSSVATTGDVSGSRRRRTPSSLPAIRRPTARAIGTACET